MKPQGSVDYRYCGQDKAYLAELLLAKGYIDDIEHLYQDPHESARHRFLHYGDMSDATNLICIAQGTGPDEIYNLAEQSHVQVRFETTEYTASADGLGTLRLLELIRAFAEVAIDLVWEGSGLEERGRDQRSGRVVVEIDQRYFRPAEVDYLRGDPSNARAKLGRHQRVSFEVLVNEMVREGIRPITEEAGRRTVGKSPARSERPTATVGA